jgi:hypothetical protein
LTENSKALLRRCKIGYNTAKTTVFSKMKIKKETKQKGQG